MMTSPPQQEFNRPASFGGEGDDKTESIKREILSGGGLFKTLPQFLPYMDLKTVRYTPTISGYSFTPSNTQKYLHKLAA